MMGSFRPGNPEGETIYACAFRLKIV